MDHRALGDASSWIEQWKGCLPNEEAARSEWEIAAALVWCAEQAAKALAAIRSSPSTDALDQHRKSVELERCCFAIRGKDYVSASLVDWAWGCIRTFLNAPPRGRALHIPVAAWRPADATGLVLSLQLELLAAGTGDVFHHPRDAFATKVDQEFSDSMRDAWQAACELAKAQGCPVDCDGRWRLLSAWAWDKAARADQKPADWANERSASGAAARAWYYALGGTVPDEELVVLAQSDAAGNLSAVSGVGPKARAIAETGGFDTIAVTNENVAEATEALRQIGKLGQIRIVDIEQHGDPAQAHRLENRPVDSG
ncbi:MAG: hypothetical protein NTW21_22580 [Verrucomicrobia bacterium]|nr:hypothetical protein [Verrucomicrobiota bacterium]